MQCAKDGCARDQAKTRHLERSPLYPEQGEERHSIYKVQSESYVGNLSTLLKAVTFVSLKLSSKLCNLVSNGPMQIV